jgi:hypothetical protein
VCSDHWCYFFDFSHYFIIALPLKGIYSRIFFVKIKRDATVLALKSDSLTIALKKMMPIYNPFKSNGELEYAKFNKDSILAASEEVVPQVKLSASRKNLNYGMR